MAGNINQTGGGSGIVVEGAYGIQLYVKGGTDYYCLTCLYNAKPEDGDTNRVYSNEFVENQNFFEFYLTPKEGQPSAASIPSQLSYNELFTYDSDTDFTGSEVYIRNDSPLHRYLNNTTDSSGTLYSEYINTLKPYLYFGKIYPKSEADSIIQIETYFMKDFTLEALPEHQRTDNMREFLGVCFDQMYSKLYYKIRDVLRMSDPWEVKGEYLHYLLETFGTTSIIPSGWNGWDLDRFFIQNLPALLKRKGTYCALYGLFRFLTNTINRLNIYEQWHELLPSSAPFQGTHSISADSIEAYCYANDYEWQEHLYNDYYANSESSTTTSAATLGEKIFTVEGDDPLPRVAGQYVFITCPSASDWMEGYVTSYDSSNKKLTVNVTAAPIFDDEEGESAEPHSPWSIYYPVMAGAGMRYYANLDPYPFTKTTSWTSLPSSAETDPPTRAGCEDLRLSPHYRVEMDLSTEPINDTSIIDIATERVLLEKFEELRPVARFCNYSILLALLTDFSGRYIDIYNGFYNAYAKTKCCVDIVDPLPCCFVFHNRSNTATSITFYHNLHTKDILVQTYTDDGTQYVPPYNRFIPKNIKVEDDNNVTIELHSAQKFYAFVTSSSDDCYPNDASWLPVSELPSVPVSGEKYRDALWMVYERNRISATNKPKYEMFPISDMIDGLPHYVDFYAPSSAAYTYESITAKADYQSGARTGVTRTYTHNLATPAVIVEVFEITGDDQIKIIPDSVSIVDENRVTVTINEPSKYYNICIKKLSNSPYIRTKYDVVHDIDSLKLGDGSTLEWDARGENKLESEIPSAYYHVNSWDIYEMNRYSNGTGYNSWGIKFTIDVYEDINITEIGLFDENDDILFYSKCSAVAVAGGLDILGGVRLTLWYTIEYYDIEQ